MKRKMLAAGFCLLFLSNMSSGLQAQTAKSLTLKEAIDLSIKNSGQLKINQAKIEEATAALKEAVERRLPDFKVSGAYMYLPVNPTVDLKTGGGSNNGGSGGGSVPKVHQAAYGIANVSLPIYSGGRISYGIESAKYLEEAAKLDAGNDRQDLVLTTINAFTNLYKAKAAVKLVKENLQQSQQRVTDFGNLEKNGLLARNDLLKVQLQESNIELSLLDAENNWKLANVNMNLMLGLPEQTELLPDSTDVITTSAGVKSIEEYEQLALQHRNDLQALALRSKAANTAIKIAKAEKLPSLAFTGGYIALAVPHLVTVTNAINVGVGVQYSLSSLWKTNSKVQQAKSRETQLLASQGILSDAIRLQINQAYQNYLLSQKKIEVYNKAVEQAAENYRITKNKYDNSLVTTTDLLDADVAQLQAKLNYAFAKADAVGAYSKLLQVAGLLTDTN